jgi:hypothetical protein
MDAKTSRIPQKVLGNKTKKTRRGIEDEETKL